MLLVVDAGNTQTHLGTYRDGELVVTELELLEPSLFLDADPDAPMRFAQAIIARVNC